MATSVEANIENVGGTSASDLLSQFRHFLKYENPNNLSNLDNLVVFVMYNIIIRYIIPLRNKIIAKE